MNPPRKLHDSSIPCLIAAALILLPVPSGKASTATNDFAFYWTAARLTLEGRNPYSPTETEDLQRRLSFPGKGRLVMLNPPWTLPLIVPLGLLPYSAAKSLWFLISLALLLVSIRWLWDLYGHDPYGGEGHCSELNSSWLNRSWSNRWLGWIVAATFLPVAVVLAIGQIGPLLVFGLAAFLRFDARRRDFLAGAFLFLAALKPHLVYLVWMALLLCALCLRKWRALASFLGVLAGASAVAILLDQRAFQQYFEQLGLAGVASAETPTLGGLLRHVFGLPALQFLPALLGCGWFAGVWIKQGSRWQWQEKLPSLLLVSVATTSYGWFFDQVVLLPAALCATAVLRHSHRKWIGFALAYALINGSVLLLVLTGRTTLWYSWTALAWLVLYGLVRAGDEFPQATGGSPDRVE